MAISASTVFEVRPTNGADTSGGGFVTGASGTDRSQQNAAQITYTDLVIGATTTELTSAAFPFSAAEVGNIIQITGGTGFTVGFYQVVSVSVITATMDRSVGTGASTGGTGALGGALKTLDKADTAWAAGNKVYIKNEAWNEQATLTGTAGTSANPIRIIGYNAARDDNPTGANRPVCDRASAAGDGLTLNMNGLVFENLIFKSSAGDAVSAVTNTNRDVTFVNCRLTGNGGDGFNDGGLRGHMLLFIRCEIDANTSDGVENDANTDSCAIFVGCYVHNNGATGATLGSGSAAWSVFESNAGHGFKVAVSGGLAGAHTLVVNCVAYGNTGASTDGINMTGANRRECVWNTILKDNGNGGLDYGASNNYASRASDYNDFHGNTTAAVQSGVVNDHDVTTDPGFTDAPNGDFSIGTALKAIGFPGLLAGGLSTGYVDIGAIQRQEGSGTSTIYVGVTE